MGTAPATNVRAQEIDAIERNDDERENERGIVILRTFTACGAPAFQRSLSFAQMLECYVD